MATHNVLNLVPRREIAVNLICYICMFISKYLTLIDKKPCLYQNVCYNKYIDINKDEENIMALFETKDLEVVSAIIPINHTESKVEYFIDMKTGKGVTSAPTLDQAIAFAKSYQKLI